METFITGVVKEGRIVPSSPLPEGARVEIRVTVSTPKLPDELRAEFEAWDRASAIALELVEDLAPKGATDEAR